MELATFSALFVMLAVVGVDVCLASIGSSVNDAACKDAAHAAALADNPAAALKMAQLSTSTHQTDGYLVGVPQVTVSDFVYEDYGGRPPVNAAPYVALTTTSEVHVPVPSLFSERIWGPDGTIIFRQRCVLPIDKARVAVRNGS
jgi:hypothetical protein